VTLPCGCCEGVEVLTPGSVVNPPGLGALAYRVGTHATFLETMKARLSRLVPRLRSRAADDPSIALLDAWALVADVLTFYQERIANEGFLRTATERRSLSELAYLVGYHPRPGVAASVFLAFTLDPGYMGEIPAGTRAQSLPAPGELAQPFETSVALAARAEWSRLQPRLTRPQAVAEGVVDPDKPIWFRGLGTGLAPHDMLLVDTGGDDPQVFRVREVTPDPAGNRTRVTLQAPSVAEQLREVLGRHLAVERFEVNPRAATTRRTVDRVRRVRERIARGLTDDELASLLDEELQASRDLHAEAERSGYTKLEPWLRSLTGGLEAARERLRAQAGPPTAAGGRAAAGGNGAVPALHSVGTLVEPLTTPPSVPPASPLLLQQTVAGTFAAATDTLPMLLGAFDPGLGGLLYAAWKGLSVPPTGVVVYAMRVRAGVFGATAPPRAAERFRITLTPSIGIENGSSIRIQVEIGPDSLQQDVPFQDGTIRIPFPGANETVEVTLSNTQAHRFPDLRVALTNRRAVVTVQVVNAELQVTSSGTDPTDMELHFDPETQLIVGGTLLAEFPLDEQPDVVSLDASYPQILPGTWAVIERPDTGGEGLRLVERRIKAAKEGARANYGISAKGTQLLLDGDPWIDPAADTFDVLRGTTVFAQAEPLELADEPVTAPIEGDSIELDRVYDGLQPGRWLIVAGERADILSAGVSVTGVNAAELVMLAGVDQTVPSNLPGDAAHTVLRLATRLAYKYRPETAVVYGNVVHATHGEARAEVLGGGDAGRAGQRFILRQSPLTYVSAATPSGARSTLAVRVDDVLWHEAASFADAGPKERRYRTETGEDQRTTVVFGDGRRGARLPTGVENVRAAYRTSIGRAGNVRAGGISLLATRPLGVRGVVNPLPATGGADRDPPDQIRDNVPLAVSALDRLVSLKDYGSLARLFAGVGKAGATRLSDGRRTLVQVTIAGADDIPIAPTSDLFQNLVRTLREAGDPHQPVRVGLRELKLLVVSAGVALLPNYEWVSVEPKVRAALLATFGFAQRDFGQDALLSEAIGVVQAIEGVDYVDVDTFDAVDEGTVLDAAAGTVDLAATLGLKTRIPVEPARVDQTATDPGRRIRAAQLALLSPEVRGTLILTERTT
jgi:predicted phage baseplate assembly protein